MRVQLYRGTRSLTNVILGSIYYGTSCNLCASTKRSCSSSDMAGQTRIKQLSLHFFSFMVQSLPQQVTHTISNRSTMLAKWGTATRALHIVRTHKSRTPYIVSPAFGSARPSPPLSLFWERADQHACVPRRGRVSARAGNRMTNQ